MNRSATSRGRLIRVAMATAAMVLLVANFAAASIPSPAGLINGCYSAVTGHVRLVDSDSPDCLLGENSITWPASTQIPADLICDGCVDTTDLAANAVRTDKIADGNVGVVDLAFDPATQAELDAHKVSADHDGRYRTEAELSTPGTINSPSNPVDWTKLKSVPASFADGVDNDSTDAATLGGLPSSSFLRSNASDSFTTGTLTMDIPTALNVNGTFRVGADSELDDDLILFDDGTESFGWDEGESQFELTDGLALSGGLRVGCTSAPDVLYSILGSCAASPASGAMSSSGDLYTNFDLEVGGVAYLSKSLYMEGRNTPGGDGNQSIFFYDNDSRSERSLMWHDTSNQFRLNHALALDASQPDGQGLIGRALYTDYDGPNAPQVICFYHDSECGEFFALNAAGSFTFSNGVIIQGDLSAQDLTTSLPDPATTNGLCHSGADLDEGGPASPRSVVVCSGAPGDVAEWYETTGVSAGEIVVATDQTVSFDSDQVDARTGVVLPEKDHLTASVLTRSAQRYQDGLLGVVSTSPVQTIGRAILSVAKAPAPVAVTGRVPVKVTAAGGAIRPGDPITASAVPGAGMKATRPGMIVGYALDHFAGNGVGSILMLVRPGWHGGSADTEKMTELESRVASLESLVARLAASMRERVPEN